MKNFLKQVGQETNPLNHKVIMIKESKTKYLQ